jgi:signal transduction histidine kinase
MRLADFITANREPILGEWEAFARTCAPASGTMDIVALRDHADEMLTVIAADLKTPQDAEEQSEKSKGNAPADDAAVRTAAEQHGSGRAGSGFTVEQMISEYRALRASVIRLWMKGQGNGEPTDMRDLTRFNEAIDQALAESIWQYTQDLEYSKEMFLAILGHDLRTPLSSALMAATFMAETHELTEPYLSLTTRIVNSLRRMNHMVGDLLDFTRSRLGGGIPITPADMSLEKTVHAVVDEIATLYPNRTIRIDARGGQRGAWDCARISQLLTNLIGNALDHGSGGAEVTVVVGGNDDEATIAVHNDGLPIPAARLDGIFNPMKGPDATGNAAGGATGSLGLGLYIAERIVFAHHGKIDVESSEASGTTFTVHLPR